MSYKICYWDSNSNSQKERNATPEETIEIESRKSYVDVPQSVSMRSARIVLFRAGLLNDVSAYIANMPGEAGDLARIDWEFALTVNRNDPLVLHIIPATGKTEQEIDQMFIDASKL